MKNPLKEYTTKIILQLAAWQNDIESYERMYGMAWILLLVAGLCSSWNAGSADYSVLYGNHFNLHQDPWAATIYAFSIAAFIQVLIIVPGGVIGKIVINKLFKGTGARKHRFQLYYLTPILLTGLGWSTVLSLNMDQAVRAETQEEYQGLLHTIESRLLAKDSAITSLENKKLLQFKNDSALLAKQYKSKRLAERARIDAKIDSLQREAARLQGHYKKTGEAWARTISNRIKGKRIPALRHEYEQYFNQNQAALMDQLASTKVAIQSFYAPEIASKDSIYGALNQRYLNSVVQLDTDVNHSIQKRRAMSIFYNLISLIICFGAREVYKNINGPAGKTVPPQSKVEKVEAIQIDEVPVSQETQGPQELHKVDIYKCKRDIRTYYPRCFTKTVSGGESANETTAQKNRERVLARVKKLEEWGVRSHINFDQFEKPSFDV